MEPIIGGIKFFDFMNSIDTSGKIKFTMSVAKDSVLEFLHLSLHINEQKKDLC